MLTETDSLQDFPFLQGGGNMGALIRAFDWASTPLGPINNWPQSLRTTVGLMIAAPNPMVLLWGMDGVLIYNDGYAEFAGRRHPELLGMGAREGWPEIADFNDNIIRTVLGGQSISLPGQELVLDRRGKPESAWIDLFYTPVPGNDDKPAGVLVFVNEITERLNAERRLAEEAERQRGLFQQAPGFIIVMRGPDHVVEFANDAHRKMFGSEGWTGKPISKAFPSVAGQGFFEQLDKVYATGETFSANGAEVRYRTAPDAPDETRYHTFIYAPLYGHDGRVNGVFCQGFDVTDTHTAANHARALAELSERINEIDDPDELAYAAAKILGETLRVSRAGYGTINKVDETITIERDWNMPGVTSLAGTLHFRDYGSYIEDLKAGRTVVIANAEKDARTAAGAEALKAITAHAFVNMPVTEQGGFVALLYLNHHEPREWRESELALVREVAARTRTAVERRRAEAALRANEARLRFLDQLATETQGLTSADEILAATTRMTGAYIGADICAYADMDEDQDGFTIRGDWAGAGAQSIVGRYSLAGFGELAVRNLRAGLPLVVNNIPSELPAEAAAGFQSIGIASTICMPLVKNGRLTALMAVHRRKPHAWTEDELAIIREVTDRSWAHVQRAGADASRRESETRYEALFNAIDEGFCVIEFVDGPEGPLSDYVHVEANAAAAAHVGLREVAGQSIRKIAGDEAQTWIDLYKNVLDTGDSIRFEKEFETTGRWLELAAFRVEPPSRKQVAVLFKDLTQRKRAESALRASEENFRTLARVMPNMGWTGRPDGNLDWFNERVYGYSGAAAGELDGDRWTSIVHPDDLASAGARWAASLATGEDYQTEFRLRRADGAWRWHIARAVAIRDSDGEITRWIGANTDIQDQKEVTETLEQRVAEALAERKLLADIIQNADAFVQVVDRDMRWMAINEASANEFERIYGVRPRPGERMTDALAHLPEHANAVEAIWRRAFAEAPFIDVQEFGDTSRDRRFYEMRFYPLLGERGERAGAYQIVYDVTDRLREQNRLRETEEALRQSQKMEAVGQLTGGIAHDFNNLLGGITGSLELLEKRLADGRLEGVQRYITSAQEASRRAASLTQRLLAFSRRQTLDPKPVDANKLISGMEDLIRRTVGPTIAVEVVGAGGLWPTRVDTSQLENSLLNLCINARDAMAPNGGRLTIETANKWLDERAARDRDLPPGQYISICVTDSGTGMSPETIARAFDPFFTTKPLGQGTGLGLSMVYGFVRQSNGQVRIYSELGVGTTMCLYLPRHFGRVDEAAPVVEDETIDQGDGETVLVIDDEPILRMLILDVLEENGYRALEAGDGPSGLKILESDVRIDLLVTDVGLPGGMNGRQVADAARQHRPGLKVLFITGYAENAVIGNGHLEPGMEVLTKPFPVATLGQRIRSLIEAK